MNSSDALIEQQHTISNLSERNGECLKCCMTRDQNTVAKWECNEMMSAGGKAEWGHSGEWFPQIFYMFAEEEAACLHTKLCVERKIYGWIDAMCCAGVCVCFIVYSTFVYCETDKKGMTLDWFNWNCSTIKIKRVSYIYYAFSIDLYVLYVCVCEVACYGFLSCSARPSVSVPRLSCSSS